MLHCEEIWKPLIFLWEWTTTGKCYRWNDSLNHLISDCYVRTEMHCAVLLVVTSSASLLQTVTLQPAGGQCLPWYYCGCCDSYTVYITVTWIYYHSVCHCYCFSSVRVSIQVIRRCRDVVCLYLVLIPRQNSCTKLPTVWTPRTYKLSQLHTVWIIIY